MPVAMPRRARRQTIEEVVRTRLRELRASRGLTQEQLCESAGVSVDAVNRIENGTRVPTIATLASLATALGVEVGDLVRSEALPPARFKPPVQRIVAQLMSQPDEIQDAAEKLVRVLLSVTRS
jgi:transcriptional regulator with XRE-family HTH domain